MSKTACDNEEELVSELELSPDQLTENCLYLLVLCSN